MRRFFALTSTTTAFLIVPLMFAPSQSGAQAEEQLEPLNYVPGQVLVGLRSGAAKSPKTFVYSQIGAKTLEVIHTRAMQDAGHPPMELLQVSVPIEQAIKALSQEPWVEYAEPNWIYRTCDTNDPYYTNGQLWGMYGDSTSQVNQFGSQAGEAWRKFTGSHDVVIGVIDQGIDVNHLDLKANIWVNPDEIVNGIDDDGNGYVDDIHGWDFVNNDPTVYDGGTLDRHGTHVAGTIGAVGGNGIGVAGVNWKVTMVSLKFLGSSGGTTANAVKAVDYLTNLKTSKGLRVIASNNSWGGGGFSTSLSNAIARANNAGIFFVAAAGNGGSDGIGDNNDVTAHYPSNYTHANVIAVASITSSGAKSGFSNYGATTVDLGAPGSGIFSTLPGNSYGSLSGTSMATPHVTGALALIAAKNERITMSKLRDKLFNTTIPTSSMTGRCVTGGRLNVGTR